MVANTSYIEGTASSLTITEGLVGCSLLPADVLAELEDGEDAVL